jgi:acetoacetyl-CoA synthetase
VTEPLWTPSAERVNASNLHAFLGDVNARWDVGVTDFVSLHLWSLEHPDRFWTTLWDGAAVLGEPGDTVIAPAGELWQTRFFPDASLNFAENLLRRRDDTPAMHFAREDGVRTTTSWAQLHDLVSRVQQALRDAGVRPGDRVAAWMPNAPESYALMLGAASIGAVFSSSSPDFGANGVIDRFGQIEPTVLVAVDGYLYDGKTFDCLERLRQITAALPSVQRVVVLAYVDAEPDLDGLSGAVTWDDWLDPYAPAAVDFLPLAFDHPLYVLYSSGTTGLPKCIVHRAGGILLKLLSEHRLHCDIKPGDHVFYFTTTGWMMWNWLASTLACEAVPIVFDGAPMRDHGHGLWNLADELEFTLFGTSAKYLDSCKKMGLDPRATNDLAALRTITSTGSPLMPEAFDYVYSHIKTDVHLASISGGTDLCGCLVSGDPTAPVWPGEIQRPAIALATDIFDTDGTPAAPGEPGELVCRSPFPSMPLGFWNDPGDERYRAAYFERFPGVWHQGDFAERTEHGGFVIYGRSDATLNPGGVRIGTAEVYRQVEALDEIVESLVVGQDWDDDVRIVLFVVLRPDLELDDELVKKIRDRIRSGASPRHMPAKVIQVHDIPRTRSGKISELAVRDVVHGREVKNVEALANPESLEQFRALTELSA